MTLSVTVLITLRGVSVASVGEGIVIVTSKVYFLSSHPDWSVPGIADGLKVQITCCTSFEHESTLESMTVAVESFITMLLCGVN